MPLPLLGRPLTQVEPAQRQIVTSWLDQVGPGVGVPTLRLQFPGLARAAVADLVTDYRGRWRAEHRRLLHVLHWLRAARSGPWTSRGRCLIDGRYPFALAVRPGQRSQPVATRHGATAGGAGRVDLLFAAHGVWC
jgi:hypothetical protein